MKFTDHGNGFSLRLSAQETTEWARRWPCSTLRGRRVLVGFDRSGLLDFLLDGGKGVQDADGHEVSAIVAHFVGPKLDKGHPAYFVAVGQFV